MFDSSFPRCDFYKARLLSSILIADAYHRKPKILIYSQAPSVVVKVTMEQKSSPWLRDRRQEDSCHTLSDMSGFVLILSLCWRTLSDFRVFKVSSKERPAVLRLFKRMSVTCFPQLLCPRRTPTGRAGGCWCGSDTCLKTRTSLLSQGTWGEVSVPVRVRADPWLLLVQEWSDYDGNLLSFSHADLWFSCLLSCAATFRRKQTPPSQTPS